MRHRSSSAVAAHVPPKAQKDSSMATSLSPRHNTTRSDGLGEAPEADRLVAPMARIRLMPSARHAMVTGKGLHSVRDPNVEPSQTPALGQRAFY